MSPSLTGMSPPSLDRRRPSLELRRPSSHPKIIPSPTHNPPPPLRSVGRTSPTLADDRITFVGVHNGRDRNLLGGYDHGLEVQCLVDLAKENGFGRSSMEDMAEIVLGFSRIAKPRELGMSDWDQFWLSDEQVQYACLDAYVSFLLADALGYGYDDDDDDGYDYYYYYDDDDDGYYYDDEYLDYDDFCNPLNYNRDGEYDPDNCNPFNFYLSDFEDEISFEFS